MDEMGLNGHEFEQTLGDSGRQRSLHPLLQSMGWQRVIQDLANEQQHGDTPSHN